VVVSTVQPARAIEGLDHDVGEKGADAIRVFDILVAVPEYVPPPFTTGRATRSESAIGSIAVVNNRVNDGVVE